jgi:hypothetical protein
MMSKPNYHHVGWQAMEHFLASRNLLPMDAVEVFIRPLKERASREIK